MIDFDALHDATLVAFDVNWASGLLRCRLKVELGEIRLVHLLAQDLSSLKCSRTFPWGRSISINKITARQLEDRTLLIIEMQSGDTIEANIKHVSIE